MDENRLPELPQESFRPMIAQSVQLEQFLGEELIFCFRDLDGVHTFTTCYGDIYKTVNALRDYVRLLTFRASFTSAPKVSKPRQSLIFAI